MSDKDFVEKAAVKGLSRKKDQKAKSSQKPALPEKGSAEAEIHRQAAMAANIRLSEPDLPQKGGAEAAVHNMAAKGSAPAQGARLDFLALVLLIPLAIVGGVYAYSGKMRGDINALMTASDANPATPKSATNASPAASKNAKTDAAKTPAVKTPATKATAPAKLATAPANAPKTAPKTATKPLAKPAAKPAKARWDYKNTKWAALDPAFKTCGSGKSQSPINIVAGAPLSGPNFQFNYAPSSGKVINTGRAIRIELTKTAQGQANQLLVNGKPYDLIEFHFHTPGEHAINGRRAPMEVHLVHKNAQNQMAFVAIMINAGGTNQLIDHMPVPANKGDYSSSGGPNINPALLLPDNRRAFTYSGSLTTPPCTQNVGWVVLQSSLGVAPATLAKFQKIMGRNNRPLQPANGRGIYVAN